MQVDMNQKDEAMAVLAFKLEVTRGERDKETEKLEEVSNFHDLNSTTPAAFSNQPPASDATWTIIPRRTRSHKYAIATSYSNPKRNHDNRKHKHETQVPRFS